MPSVEECISERESRWFMKRNIILKLNYNNYYINFINGLVRV